jgi:hypothetical protein
MSDATEQDRWKSMAPEGLLKEAQTLTEQFKATHDQSLVPRIQALRQEAHERQTGPQINGQEAQGITKACPYCGESILAVARKCKHCASMLDGSEPAQNVRVTAADPFAQLHAPIAGKKKGKITFIGYLGIVLGFFFMVVACLLPDVTWDQAVGTFALGAGVALSCFLWARKGR